MIYQRTGANTLGVVIGKACPRVSELALLCLYCLTWGHDLSAHIHTWERRPGEPNVKQMPANGNPKPYSFKILGFVTGLIALIVLVTAFEFTERQAKGSSLMSLVFWVAIVVLVGQRARGLLRALRDSEHKFRAIFEQAAVVMAQVA